MKFSKLTAAVVCLSLFAGAAFAQSQTVKSQNSKSERTVEDEYLSDVEDIIITELAASEDYDNKLVALQYLENAVNEGRSSPGMVAALDSLAGEGIKSQSRTNGRIMNNFPDVRAKACDILAEIPTEESKNTLLAVVADDNEPMVVASAVRSLGLIGLNDDKDDVVATINFISHKFNALNPTSSLALEVLNAYEKLAPQVTDKGPMIQSIAEIAANGRYVLPVRQKALGMLRSFQTIAGNSNGSSGNSRADAVEK